MCRGPGAGTCRRPRCSPAGGGWDGRSWKRCSGRRPARSRARARRPGRRRCGAAGSCARSTGSRSTCPATGANREEFGSSGTSDDIGPFPQAPAVLVTARVGRAMLGAAMDGCGVGEQTLIARLVAGHPEIFAGRVFVVDRNCLGHELATAILDAGGHLVMRVKQGISLPAVPGGWLSDGSRMSYLNAPGRRAAGRLPVRVIEHNATVPGPGGETVSELYCLASTLLDHQKFPAEQVREACPQRWSASETTIGENKTTVTGAGPSAGYHPVAGRGACRRAQLGRPRRAREDPARPVCAGTHAAVGSGHTVGGRRPDRIWSSRPEPRSPARWAAVIVAGWSHATWPRA